MGLPRWYNGKESACQAGHMGSIPGSERSPGEGSGNPFQCSSLNRGAWRATQRVGHNLATKQQSSQSSGLFHMFVNQFVSLLVAKSQTQLKRLSMHALCSRLCAKHFEHIVSLNPYNISAKSVKDL